MVSDLKRTPLLMLLLMLSLIFFSLTTFHVNAATTNIETTTFSSVDFEIDKVDHVLQFKDGGLVIIKDTVRLAPTGENGGLLQNFSLGFPIQFQSNLDYCFAYDSSHPKLDVELDVGLGGRLGFYGININFPEPVDLNTSRPYNFTAVFVFSDLIFPKIELVFRELPPPGEDIVYENETYFYSDFPMYPSLTQDAPVCNVTIILPKYVFVSNSSRSEWSVGATGFLNHTKENLKAFAYEEPIVLRWNVYHPEDPFTYEEKAWLKLGIDPDALPNAFTLISINKISRDITLNQWGQIFLSDSYHITDKAGDLSSLRIRLPDDAYDVSYHDERGDHPVDSSELPNATISFGRAFKRGESAKFTVTYRLPWENHVNHHDWRNFDLAMAFFEQKYSDWLIRELSVTITLPEGADFQFCSVPPQNVEESVTFAFYNVTPFNDLDFHLAYEYLIFWASFHPTLWMGLLVIIVSVIALLWQAPKPPSVPVIPVSPKALRSFLDTYERKTRTIRELEMLEQQVRKRKVPRRRYKVRKSALDSRLSVLSKDLTGLREEIRKAGSRYVNAMRQIEVAETELEESEAAIRRIELRYRRREISKGTYRSLLEEYNRRKERAETTIDGILLRLREEIR